MSSSAQATSTIFPPDLDQINVVEQSPELFGWLPSYVGLLSLAACIAMLASSKPLKSDLAGYAIAAGLGIFAGLMLWYEFRRRSHRTVLVARGGDIGVYRNRAFVSTITTNQLVRYQLNWFNTIRFLLGPVAAGCILLFGPLFWGKPASSSELWGLPVGGIVILIGCASGIRTRILLEHWRIPKGRRSEEIMFAKGTGRGILEKNL